MDVASVWRIEVARNDAWIDVVFHGRHNLSRIVYLTVPERLVLPAFGGPWRTRDTNDPHKKAPRMYEPSTSRGVIKCTVYTNTGLPFQLMTTRAALALKGLALAGTREQADIG